MNTTRIGILIGVAMVLGCQNQSTELDTGTEPPPLTGPRPRQPIVPLSELGVVSFLAWTDPRDVPLDPPEADPYRQGHASTMHPRQIVQYDSSGEPSIELTAKRNAEQFQRHYERMVERWSIKGQPMPVGWIPWDIGGTFRTQNVPRTLWTNANAAAYESGARLETATDRNWWDSVHDLTVSEIDVEVDQVIFDVEWTPQFWDYMDRQMFAFVGTAAVRWPGALIHNYDRPATTYGGHEAVVCYGETIKKNVTKVLEAFDRGNQVVAWVPAPDHYKTRQDFCFTPTYYREMMQVLYALGVRHFVNWIPTRIPRWYCVDGEPMQGTPEVDWAFIIEVYSSFASVD